MVEEVVGRDRGIIFAVVEEAVVEISAWNRGKGKGRGVILLCAGTGIVGGWEL